MYREQKQISQFSVSVYYNGSDDTWTAFVFDLDKSYTEKTAQRAMSVAGSAIDKFRSYQKDRKW